MYILFASGLTFFPIHPVVKLFLPRPVLGDGMKCVLFRVHPLIYLVPHVTDAICIALHVPSFSSASNSTEPLVYPSASGGRIFRVDILVSVRYARLTRSVFHILTSSHFAFAVVFVSNPFMTQSL